MPAIRRCTLPEGAFLAAYQADGSYADCYATAMAGTVSLEEFVAAFYTTRVFKLERLLLKWAVSKPSTDAQAGQLAAGHITTFAAWQVERRGQDQLLMSDFQARTRSWFMVAPDTAGNHTATRLYFGSAVVPVTNPRTGKAAMGWVFGALLGFHELYSVVLLRAAVSRLKANRNQ